MASKQKSTDESERLKQRESRNNPTGSLRDGLDRGMGAGNGSDLFGDMGWKGIVLLILVLFLGYVLYRYFFS